VLSAVLLWSTSGLFAKNDIFAVWPTEHRGLLFGFWRAFFAGALLLPWVRRPRWDLRLIPMAATFAVMNGSFLCSMVLTTAANAIWLQATAPIWVLLFSIFFLRHPRRPADAFFAVMCGLGIGYILWDGRTTEQSTAGVLLGLLSGVTFGGVVIWLRVLRSTNGTFLIALNQLAAACSMLPIILSLGVWRTPTWPQLLVLAAFGIGQMGIPYLLMATAVRSISSLEASVLALLEPILVPIWVALLIGEQPAAATIVGAGLILIGLATKYAAQWRSTTP